VLQLDLLSDIQQLLLNAALLLAGHLQQQQQRSRHGIAGQPKVAKGTQSVQTLQTAAHVLPMHAYCSPFAANTALKPR
jgi:hypothetical protein